MKKPLKPLLWVLILIMSISLVAVFSSGGCMPAVSPEEESVVEEQVSEPAVAEEPEEEPIKLFSGIAGVEKTKSNMPWSEELKQNFLDNINNPIFIVVLFLLVIICLLWLIYSKKDKKWGIN